MGSLLLKCVEWNANTTLEYLLTLNHFKHLFVAFNYQLKRIKLSSLNLITVYPIGRGRIFFINLSWKRVFIQHNHTTWSNMNELITGKQAGVLSLGNIFNISTEACLMIKKSSISWRMVFIALFGFVCQRVGFDEGVSFWRRAGPLDAFHPSSDSETFTLAFFSHTSVKVQSDPRIAFKDFRCQHFI